MNMAQGSVQAEAGVRVQGMALQNMKDQGAEMAKMVQSTEAITDPTKGNYVDMFA